MTTAASRSGFHRLRRAGFARLWSDPSEVTLFRDRDGVRWATDYYRLLRVDALGEHGSDLDTVPDGTYKVDGTAVVPEPPTTSEPAARGQEFLDSHTDQADWIDLARTSWLVDFGRYAQPHRLLRRADDRPVLAAEDGLAALTRWIEPGTLHLAQASGPPGAAIRARRHLDPPHPGRVVTVGYFTPVLGSPPLDPPIWITPAGEVG